MEEEEKDHVIKQDGGSNKYVIWLDNERDFTHTITDESESLGQVYLVRNDLTKIALRDIAYDSEILHMTPRQEHWLFLCETVKGNIRLQREILSNG